MLFVSAMLHDMDSPCNSMYLLHDLYSVLVESHCDLCVLLFVLTLLPHNAWLRSFSAGASIKYSISIWPLCLPVSLLKGEMLYHPYHACHDCLKLLSVLWLTSLLSTIDWPFVQYLLMSGDILSSLPLVRLLIHYPAVQWLSFHRSLSAILFFTLYKFVSSLQ